MYICIEGVDGVGKTTTVNCLSEKLRNSGYNVLQTREPSIHSEVAKKLYDIIKNDNLTPLAREYVLQANRDLHMNEIIRPFLFKQCEKSIIVQDRGLLSAYCYSLEYTNTKITDGLSSVVRECGLRIMRDIMYDYVFLLICDNVKERLTRRGQLDNIEKHVDFERLGRAYSKYSKLFNTFVINTTNITPEQVCDKILEIIKLNGDHRR